MENLEDNNQEQKIPAEKGTLGEPQRRSPHDPMEDRHLPTEALQARQAAIGERRKYFGPTSNKTEEDETLNKDNTQDVPQTDCEEPSGAQG